MSETAGRCVLLDTVTEKVDDAKMTHARAGFVAVSSDEQWLATSGWHSSQVKIWDIPARRLIREWEVGPSARVFVTPDNQQLIVARSASFTFHNIKAPGVSRQFPREIGLFPGLVAFTTDGKLMAMEMAPGIIELQEVSSGRTVARLEDPQGDQSTWLGFTPDGTQLLVAARYADSIHRWDLRAIRSRLKTMNLDWDWPQFPELTPGELASAQDPRPVQVRVVNAPEAQP